MRLTKKIGGLALSGAIACGVATVTSAVAPAASAQPACEGQTALASMAEPLDRIITPDGKEVTISDKRNVQQFVYLSSCDAEKLAKLISGLEKGDDVKKEIVKAIPGVDKFANQVVKGVKDGKVLTAQNLKDQSSDFTSGVILVIKNGTIGLIAKQITS
ncbi:hypothetical protein [Corynebacterium parakroppenstedtii]|uniref:hypothetical protein n=1 Tax=Corynebacterium parakroppenstedtii TaxID=2828363 RepID=UPI001C8DA2CE|nr:hypothetical protein [Corynebacterium parakroppenstedtii]MBY0788462.1 hypothetical protein [Corynebacterium parakroppenstedtii]